MKKRYLLNSLILLFSSLAFAQTLPPKVAYPLNVKQIHSGHSLTDPLFNNWPGQYVYLISDILGGSSNNVGKSTIPGSQIRFRWLNVPGYGQPDARHDIANWELLSITEGVPLLIEGANTAQWYLEGIQQQKEYLSLFVNNAWNNGNMGNGAPTLLWTTWTNIDNSNGPWRQMLDTQGEEFERMQDYANANKPSAAPPVYIIPGHKMMARIYDDIQLGNVPGITNINQFFSDNIHLNSLGDYAVAMIHYACIYNTSPVGLTNNLLPSYNTSPRPSTALATYLQTIIWEVVTSYPRTGIYPLLALTKEMNYETKFFIYPNPANELLHIRSHNNSLSIDLDYTIYNNLGATLITGKGNLINIQGLPSGLYYLKTGNSFFKFIKSEM